jgi:secondary thiamine-phosphate synthase enzyme
MAKEGKVLQFTVESQERVEVVNITERVAQCLPADAKGICMVYCPHTTMALLIGEDEKALMQDYARAVQKLLAGCGPFGHIVNGCANAEAHIISALSGCSVHVPVENGQLLLGRCQSILLLELDGPRKRTVQVLLNG